MTKLSGKVAIIIDSSVREIRDLGPEAIEVKDNVLPFTPGDIPEYDEDTEVLEGPTYTIGADSVTSSYSVRGKTAQEVAAEKDVAVAEINGRYEVLMRVFLRFENTDRAIKARVNQSVPGAFPVGETTPVTLEQVKTFIRGLLNDV